MRAQTTLDFAIGMSFFLLAVAFVFAFVPGMIDPFTGSTQEEMTASNRLADRLATDALASPDEPTVLNETCTRRFFDTSAAPGTCAFAADNGDGPGDRLEVDDRLSVNATITGDADDDGNGGLLCWDDAAASVAEESSGNCGDSADVTFAGGDAPPDGQSVVSATRRVTIGDTDARLVVRAW